MSVRFALVVIDFFLPVCYPSLVTLSRILAFPPPPASPLSHSIVPVFINVSLLYLHTSFSYTHAGCSVYSVAHRGAWLAAGTVDGDVLFYDFTNGSRTDAAAAAAAVAGWERNVMLSATAPAAT